MINNCPMFPQHLFIICVLIPLFIYFGKKTMKIVSFSMQIILNLKSPGNIKNCSNWVTFFCNLLFDIFSIRYLL